MSKSNNIIDKLEKIYMESFNSMNNIKTFDDSKISWTNNSGRARPYGSVDASELGLNAGDVPYTIVRSKVGYELLLKLVNKKEGTERVFKVQKIIDGDLQQNYSREVRAWRFESLDGKIRLDVFND